MSTKSQWSAPHRNAAGLSIAYVLPFLFNISARLSHIYTKQVLPAARRIVLFLCFIPLFLSLYVEHLAAQVNSVATKDRIVVVISLDGFPAYALDDPNIPLPTLRRLAKEGARAEAMVPVNPTVTWPNHTTMITGVNSAKHSVLYNGLALRSEGVPVRVEPWVDKLELVRVPTVYDLAHKAGLTTAEVDWVAIQNAKTITWSFAERPKPDGSVERQMVSAGLITREDLTGFEKMSITWRDDVWTKACLYILRKHRPNLMLFHLLNTDTVQHRYGARSLAANTALAYADSKVQAILDALAESALLERSTILVVSDHGFKTAKRTIVSNALLRQKGLLREENGKITCDAYVVPEGGTAMVYVTNESKKAELTNKLKDLFADVEGISRILTPAEFAQFGYPDPKDNPRMADLVLVARDGYNFSGGVQGEAVRDVESAGSHGYLNTEPEMNAIFVAWGRGIRKGKQLSTIRNLDIAPTIAALLGITMTDVDGRALTELFIR